MKMYSNVAFPGAINSCCSTFSFRFGVFHVFFFETLIVIQGRSEVIENCSFQCLKISLNNISVKIRKSVNPTNVFFALNFKYTYLHTFFFVNLRKFFISLQYSTSRTIQTTDSVSIGILPISFCTAKNSLGVMFTSYFTSEDRFTKYFATV